MEGKSIENMKHDERLTLSVKEAAAMMGVGVALMYELTHVKGFPCITIGRKRIIIKSKFINWVESSGGIELKQE